MEYRFIIKRDVEDEIICGPIAIIPEDLRRGDFIKYKTWDGLIVESIVTCGNKTDVYLMFFRPQYKFEIKDLPTIVRCKP